MKLSCRQVAAVWLLAISALTSAHHGIGAQFDTQSEIEIEGIITAPNKLARGGWTKNTLKPGDELQIRGEIARNGGHSIRVMEVVLLATRRVA